MTTPRLHHVGLACASIEDELAVLALVGMEADGGPFEDEAQGVRGVFVGGPSGRVELLEPLPGSDVLEPWLRGAGRLYHLAFETSDLDELASTLKAAGAITVRPPAPATAFGGRRISFLMLPGKLLIELIEAES